MIITSVRSFATVSGRTGGALVRSADERVRTGGVTIEPALLLERMAGTLRHDVGPAVEDPFARTQAFMASVVLAKLAGQLRAEAEDDAAPTTSPCPAAARAAGGAPPGAAGRRRRRPRLDGARPGGTRSSRRSTPGRDALGDETFERLLGVLRSALRARLDRALAYAR